MADTTISPNMNLPIPTVSECPGPDWATDVNSCLTAIDSHDHSPGYGVQITPSGININAALPMNGNNLTTANSVGFSALLAAVTSLLRTLQVVSKDLYFIDGDGNSVRITQGGSVTGSSGTITGLPSGTASASFSAGTFTFNSATNTKATMSVGPVAIGSTTANGKQTTVSSSGSMPANVSLVWPQAQGAANSIMSNDGSGNMSWSLITAILTAAGVGSSQSSTASAVSVTSSVTSVTSISLTAGTWLIMGVMDVVGVTVGTAATMYAGINTSNSSFSGTTNSKSKITFGVPATGIAAATFAPFVVTPSVTTNYYLIGQVPGGEFTADVDGTITAVKLGA